MLVRARALLRLAVSPLADLIRLVPSNARVFDVGCGTGAFLALVGQTRAPAALYGSEVDGSTAAHASVLLSRLDGAGSREVFVTARPAEGTPLRDCDIVTLIDVLHHIPAAEQRTFVTEIAASLRPGAAFLLKEIDRSRRAGAWANRMHDRVFGDGAGHERTAATLEQWLKDSGLRIEHRRSDWKLWYPHVTLLARKPRPEGS